MGHVGDKRPGAMSDEQAVHRVARFSSGQLSRKVDTTSRDASVRTVTASAGDVAVRSPPAGRTARQEIDPDLATHPARVPLVARVT
jgi:hypothetical protein